MSAFHILSYTPFTTRAASTCLLSHHVNTLLTFRLHLYVCFIPCFSCATHTQSCAYTMFLGTTHIQSCIHPFVVTSCVVLCSHSKLHSPVYCYIMVLLNLTGAVCTHRSGTSLLTNITAFFSGLRSLPRWSVTFHRPTFCLILVRIHSDWSPFTSGSYSLRLVSCPSSPNSSSAEVSGPIGVRFLLCFHKLFICLSR